MELSPLLIGILAIALFVLYLVKEVLEIEVGAVATKGVAITFASEEVMQVASHRLSLVEPRLRHDMFAVVRQSCCDRVLYCAPISCGPILQQDCGKLFLSHMKDRGIFLDQFLRTEILS